MRFLLLLGCIAVAAAQFPNFFGRPPQRRPQQFFRRPPQQSFRPRPAGPPPGRAPSGGGGADGSNGGSEYHYSWLHDGNRKYTHGGAVGYCNGLGGGWGPVSIETGGESSYINGVIGSNRKEYIWTGGVKAGSGWRWSSGGSFSGLNWSSTGGARRPQPDNREGNENCLAILNDFYRDGIKWHDVSCHHTKPIICERRA